MQQINKITAEAFTGLLRRFIKIDPEGDENDLILAYENLFNHQPIGSLIKNNKLAETVEYLKEVMTMHQLTSLEGLTDHFNRKRTQTREFLTALIKQTKNETPPGTEKDLPAMPAVNTSLYKNIFLKLHRSAPPKTLTAANRPFHHFINALYRQMYITESHFKPKDEYTGISVYFFVSEPMRPDTFSNHISSHYLMCFYANDGNRPLNLIKSRNFALKERQRPFVISFGGSGQISHYINAIFVTEMEAAYENYIKIIKAERPMTATKLKKGLIEWLLYSKLRKPDNCKVFFDHLRPSSMAPANHENHKLSLVKVRSQLAAIVSELYDKKLSLKKWTILKSPPGHTWITSDNAGFSINIQEWYRHSRHRPVVDTLLVNIKQDSAIYFPLSASYCLRIHPYDLNDACYSDADHTIIAFEECSEQELTIINRLTYCTQEQFTVTVDLKSLEQCNKTIRPYANITF
ncbi:hypothetical protein SAMN04488505_102741 [Chitinophaga rupis]|uniref:Uncharacterized protein n=1 Tax=Chitinophaga rupis TaxID=573321 RepID=A0A1H7RXH4_9BACT|nr:hypothetical protein [Chitinophaga rupis]SEL64087.1 hypothetical protein SAMN04488505_102741 [Chitinophaga rupis]